MKVFKFGGASVKDAEGIINVKTVLETSGYEQTLMVLSAMGKTTNALEILLEKYQKKEDYLSLITKLKEQHRSIAQDLFSKEHLVFAAIDKLITDLSSFLDRNKSSKYNFIYDQIICFGELLSTTIVSHYLNQEGITNTWLDVRDYLKTDSTYREGKVLWKETEEAIAQLDPSTFYITQGFIAANENGLTVTLGREGSDYTGAIFAYCLNADSMTIWKDVPGVLSADPRYFKDPTLLNHISYEEAIELSYYGASVIHPKTLQPLQRKEIPFFVKSFIQPSGAGTSIKKGTPIEPHVPCFILKREQILLELSTKDFTFITENHLSEIFRLLSKHRIKVNLIQNSAIHLSLILEDKLNNLGDFLDEIEPNYKNQLTPDTLLYTVRHYDKESEEQISKGKKPLLKQKIKNTLQLVVLNN